MLKSKRRSLQFDSLEGKLLLSTGIRDPATAVHHVTVHHVTIHRDTVKPFLLNGNLSGTPMGSPDRLGYSVSSFPVSGRVGSMGNVTGSFYLADTFVPIGKRPDLGDSTLILTNPNGSIQLTITPDKSNLYHFTISGGTNHYATMTGSGTLSIAPSQGSVNFVIAVHSGKSA